MFMNTRISRSVAVLGIITAMQLAQMLPASAKSGGVRPGAGFFGMHDLAVGYGSFPVVPIGTIRLWDTGTSWRDLEPARGVWNFRTLDAALNNAAAHGSKVHLVLGQTPQWAARHPYQTGSVYGLGAGSPPARFADWRHYVRVVVRHCKGRVASYEGWNEFDLKMYYQGSLADMVRMQRIAYHEIKRIDPKAKLTTPSFVVRSAHTREVMYRFASKGGTRWADAVAFHGYPPPNGTPEDAVRYVRIIRRHLQREGVDKPLWNTEMNFGLPWGGKGPSTVLTPAQQSSYIIRAQLLELAAHVEEFYWYSWLAAAFQSIKMTNPADGTAAPPAWAFATVQRWLDGRFHGCQRGEYGGYRCDIIYRHGEGTVWWHPDDHIKVILNRHQRAYDMYGHRLYGHRLYVGSEPVLVRQAG